MKKFNQNYRPSFKSLKARNQKQKEFFEATEKNDVVFSVGVAGTGKTIISVASALKALNDQKVHRIVITRPVVEAGEKLGFLPGDLYEKVNPYLRPIYDAFFDLIGPELFDKWKSQEIIEIVPLAFMRGRNLNNAFIILDEGQNTTAEQMKMFLTRMGEGSKIVVTGDITQIDLPNKAQSGLIHVIDILKNVQGISFITFSEEDVVRHEMVKRIVYAYAEAETKKK